MRKNKPTKKHNLPKKLVQESVTISGQIYRDSDFSWAGKALYGLIVQLSLNRTNEGCTASNKYLSGHIGKNPIWISKEITKMKKNGYIYEQSFDGKVRVLMPFFENLDLAVSLTPLSRIAKSEKVIPIFKNNKDNKDIPSHNSPIKKSYKQNYYIITSKHNRKLKKKHPNLMKNISSNSIINGAREIEKLERIDKFNFNEIKLSILWSTTDEFWSKQILSCASIRNRSKNGNTKFKNMFIAYLEATENETSNSDVPVKDRKIIDVIQKDYHPFTDTQLLLTIPKMRKAYKETKTAPGELTDLITFIWEYIKYLKKQEWITDPHPSLFRPDGKMWGKFIDDLKENKMIM